METEGHFTLYLDETGDHLLYSEEEYINNPNLETHCTLLGLIIKNNDKKKVKELLKELKEYFWRTDEIILHGVKIRHRQGAFAIFHHKKELYDEFKVKIIQLMDAINPVIICVSLNKRIWIEKYPRKYYFKDDPYEQAFIFLLEKYARFLNDQDSKKVVGKVCAERRDTKKDKALMATYKFIRNNGTQYKNKKYFNKLSEKMDFNDKSFNVPGLQLSDYCSYPFYVNHRFPNRPNKLFEIIKKYLFFAGYKAWPNP